MRGRNSIGKPRVGRAPLAGALVCLAVLVAVCGVFPGQQAGTADAAPDAAAVAAFQDSARQPSARLAKAVRHSITYELSGGSGGPSSKTGLKDGAEYTIPTKKPTRTGYRFSGWKASKSGRVYNPGKTITVTRDIKFTAQWEAHTLTIRFYTPQVDIKAHATGHTSAGSYAAGSFLARASIEYGKTDGKATWNGEVHTDQNGLPDYYFSGSLWHFTAQGYRASREWRIGSHRGTVVSSRKTWSSAQALARELGGNLAAGDVKVSLYAWMEPNSYTIRYRANGAVGAMGDTAAVYDVGIQLRKNAFARPGYAFKGWASSSSRASAGTVDYVDCAYVSKLTSSHGTVCELHAVWEEKTYTVGYSANGGSGGAAETSCPYGELSSSRLASAGFYREGYSFGGWSRWPGSGGSRDFEAGASLREVLDSGAFGTGTYVTLHATWVPNRYFISYDGNGATSGSMAQTFASYGSAVRLSSNAFRRWGNGFEYRFGGWASSPQRAMAGLVDYSEGQYVSDLISRDGGTVTLYAVWQVPVWSVSYDLAGGSWPEGSDPAYRYQGGGHRFSLPVPMRAPAGGYAFAGWTGTGLSAPSRSVVVTPSNGDSGNRHYVATWTALEFPIEYDLGDARGRKAVLPAAGRTSYTCETDDFHLPHPTRRGYDFLGWTGEGVDRPRADVRIARGSTGARSYRAHWKRAGTRVEFDANGGTGAMGPQEIPGATFAKLDSCAFENGGLSFAGWNTRADGSGASYADRQLVRADMLEAPVLYAQWTDLPVFQNRFEPKGGVSVQKRGSGGRPLAGATFAVVKSGEDTVEDALAWAEVAKTGAKSASLDISADADRLNDFWVRDIVSDATGTASSGDSELEAGWYAVFETSAPAGYEIGSDPPCWAVLVAEQGKLESEGYMDPEEDPVRMEAENAATDEPRSGIAVKKTDSAGRPLAGAVFEARRKAEVDAAIAAYEGHKDETDESGALVYTSASHYVDETVAPLATFQSGADGIARSDSRACEPSTETYVVETRAPEGYDRPGHDYLNGENVALVISGAENGTFNSAEAAPTFVDVPQRGFAEIRAEKHLVGDRLGVGQYSFLLEDAPGNPRATVPESGVAATNGIADVEVGADGTAEQVEDPACVRFAPIEYTVADVGKTFRYVVREVASDSSTKVAHDQKAAVYEVRVAGGRAGDLDVETRLVEGAGGGEEDGIAVFENAVKRGAAVLKARKVLSGARLEARQFSFAAYSDAACTQQVGATAQNDGLGNVAIGPIGYGFEDIGQHELYVRELPASLPGMSCDERVYKATVTVSDSATPALDVDVSWSDGATGAAVEGAPVFTNVYGPKGSVVLEAKKTLSGGTLSDGMFAFEALERSRGGRKVVATGTNDAFGKVVFSRIDYSRADIGEHVYQLRERGGSPGYESDGHAEAVRVTVADDDDGALRVSARYEDDGCAFSNRAKSGTAVLRAAKTLADGNGEPVATRTLEAGEFEFEAFSDEACTQSTGLKGTNDAQGRVRIGTIACTPADVGTTKSYWIRESPVSSPGISGDSRIVRADVKTLDKGGHDLVCEVSYSGGAQASETRQATFENVYAPQGEVLLSATKRVLRGQMRKGQFRFEAIERVGGREVVVATGENIRGGVESEVSFSPVRYGLSDVGEHVYRLREVDGGESGVEYDFHVETVRVRVVDDGSGILKAEVSQDADGAVFENKITELAMPQSGASGAWAPVSFAGLVAACLGAAFIVRRRRTLR